MSLASRNSPQVREILAKNAPFAHAGDQASHWAYAGYKGGSEPGVLSMTYLLRRDDGKWFVVSLGFNAAEGGTLDDAKILNVALGVIELLGAAR